MCNSAQVLVKRSPMLGTFVSIKTKCIKLIIIGKITLVPVAFLMALSIFLSLKIVFDLANSVGSDEMMHNDHFYLGHNCLPKYTFRSHRYNVKD